MNDITKIRLQQQHEVLFHQLKELSEEFMLTSFNHKWSIFQNIAHMGRYQEVYEMRIHAILTGHQPQFNRYEAAQDPAWNSWQQLSVKQALGKLKLKRRMLRDELSLLTEVQEKLSGVHPKFGVMNVLEWTEFFLLHEAHHIYQIFRIIHENKLEENA
ncbi:MAG: DinB family protein [Flammeovirgaceae bacterium]